VEGLGPSKVENVPGRLILKAPLPCDTTATQNSETVSDLDSYALHILCIKSKVTMRKFNM